MKKQQGFTLIELIIVIVILGILAVTAAPKFLNIQGDANASTIQGIDGALNGAMNIVYGKAVIAGSHKTASTVSPAPKVSSDDGSSISLNYGYPTANAAGVLAAINITAADLTAATPPAENSADFNFDVVGTAAVIYANGSTKPAAATSVGCFVWYTGASFAAGPPAVYTPASTTVKTDGC